MRYFGGTSLVERAGFSKNPWILEAGEGPKLARRTRFYRCTCRRWPKLFTQTAKKNKVFAAGIHYRTLIGKF